MRGLALALTVMMVLAGCLGGTGDETVDPASTNDTSGPQAASSSADGTPEAQAPEEMAPRTLEAPPQWQVGEWWEITLTSPLLSQGEVTWTRVVAGLEGSDYLVGQPRDTWSSEAILFHFPGMGEVAMDDLSFEAHDARFHPVQFPVAEGTEWDTSFEALDVSAQVTSVDGTTAEIWYCCGRNVTATYDAEMGMLTRMEAEGLLTYEVTDHGFGYEGVVTVPHGHDLVFNHGRIASVVSTSATEPAPPIEEVELSDDYGRVTFAGIVGDITDQLPVGGAYLERATGPDGTEYTTQRLPVEGAGLTVNVFETTELGGTWTLEHAAAGPGIAFTEGIAYHVFDMMLPEGHLLGDHSEHVT